MIEAARSPRFVRWFGHHVESKLRATFCAVHVRGLDRLRGYKAQTPLLIISNHSAWWDPLVAIWLCTRKLDDVAAYGMMDAANLQRLRFFRWMGAFGVDLGSRRDGAQVARYALRLLEDPRTLVWIYPQGAERPPHEPLHFLPGAAGIARRAPNARVVPVAVQYVFEGQEKPSLYISVGNVMTREHAADVSAQQRAVEAELELLRGALGGADDRFSTYLHTQPSWLAGLASSALDRLAALIQPDARPRALPADRSSSKHR